MTLDQFMARLTELRVAQGGHLPVVIQDGLFGSFIPFEEISVLGTDRVSSINGANQCLVLGPYHAPLHSLPAGFRFRDIADMGDHAVQLILRNTKTEILIVALKGEPDEVRQKLLANMSKRAGQCFIEDFDVKGPMRLSEVVAAQREIVETIGRLRDEGQIWFD
jgi:hypothetical protein